MKGTCFPLSEAHLLFPLSVLTSWKKRMSFSGCKLGFLFSIILDFQTSFYVILRIVTLVQFKTHSGKWLKTLQELILKTIFSASAADFILRQNQFQIQCSGRARCSCVRSFCLLWNKKCKMLGGKRENLMKNGRSTDSSNQTRSSTHHSCSQSF